MDLNKEESSDSLIAKSKIDFFIRELEKKTRSYIFFENEKVYYSDLVRKIEYTEHFFNAIKNEIIILMIPNSIDFIVYYLAIIKSGNIVMPIDYKTKMDNLLNIISVSGSKIVIHNNTKLQICNKKINFVNCKDYQQLNKLSKLYVEKQKYEDINVIYCTSGSTSKPKYVCFQFDAILRNVVSNIKALEIEEDDCFLVSLPMNFSYCLHAHILSHLYKGANLIIKPNSTFSNRAFVNLLNKYHVSSFATVPSFIRQMYKYLDTTSLPYLRKIYIGADFCNLDTRLYLNMINPKIDYYYTYGMTEAGPRISTYKFNRKDKANNSVGRALDICQIKIIVEGREADCYEKGEVLVKSSSLMLRYLNNEVLTEETIVDGWLHTGDIGYMDENNNLYLVGRIKNIIKLNGLLISPEEIEDVIKKVHIVENAFVYFKNELLFCDIMLKDNSNESEAIKLIKLNCSNILLPEKIPKKFRFVRQLELTNSGKIKR